MSEIVKIKYCQLAEKFPERVETKLGATFDYLEIFQASDTGKWTRQKINFRLSKTSSPKIISN